MFYIVLQLTLVSICCELAGISQACTNQVLVLAMSQ